MKKEWIMILAVAAVVYYFWRKQGKPAGTGTASVANYDESPLYDLPTWEKVIGWLKSAPQQVKDKINQEIDPITGLPKTV